MTYVTIEPRGDIELDYRIMMIELSLQDELHPTSLIDIPLNDDDWSEISYFDAMGRYAAG